MFLPNEPGRVLEVPECSIIGSSSLSWQSDEILWGEVLAVDVEVVTLHALVSVCENLDGHIEKVQHSEKKKNHDRHLLTKILMGLRRTINCSYLGC
jgi:hypothetical protein